MDPPHRRRPETRRSARGEVGHRDVIRLRQRRTMAVLIVLALVTAALAWWQNSMALLLVHLFVDSLIALYVAALGPDEAAPAVAPQGDPRLRTSHRVGGAPGQGHRQLTAMDFDFADDARSVLDARFAARESGYLRIPSGDQGLGQRNPRPAPQGVGAGDTADRARRVSRIGRDHRDARPTTPTSSTPGSSRRRPRSTPRPGSPGRCSGASRSPDSPSSVSTRCPTSTVWGRRWVRCDVACSTCSVRAT